MGSEASVPPPRRATPIISVQGNPPQPGPYPALPAAPDSPTPRGHRHQHSCQFVNSPSPDNSKMSFRPISLPGGPSSRNGNRSCWHQDRPYPTTRDQPTRYSAGEDHSYTHIRSDRTTPRVAAAAAKGCGSMIMIRSDGPLLSTSMNSSTSSQCCLHRSS